MTINEVIEDLTVIEALETVDGSEYCNNVKASTLKSAITFLRKYRNLANMIITKENYYLQDREGTRKKIALALLRALKESVDNDNK